MKTFALLATIGSIVSAAPVAAPNSRYVVVLKPGQPAEAADTILGQIQGGSTTARASAMNKFAFDPFSAFTADLDAQQLDKIKSDSRVAYVEADGIMTTMQGGNSTAVQPDAPWGLARISSRTPGATEYKYDQSAGEGTCTYVIDTGIVPDLEEFEGRAEAAKSFVPGSNTDDNGHGTHVAGTVGAKTYGVAKKTKIYGVKVLDADGSGSNSQVISGIEFAVTDSASRSCPKGVIVNMSLGGSKSQAINDAAAAAVSAGLFMVVAAGNDGADYHDYSPASEPSAFAVGASDSGDALAEFSNWGEGLGVIAPGVDVLSLTPEGATVEHSGTSMASPHVAGLAAYLAGLSSTKLSVEELKSQIQSLATKDAVTLTSAAEGTPNLLAFNGVEAARRRRALKRAPVVNFSPLF